MCWCGWWVVSVCVCVCVYLSVYVVRVCVDGCGWCGGWCMEERMDGCGLWACMCPSVCRVATITCVWMGVGGVVGGVWRNVWMGASGGLCVYPSVCRVATVTCVCRWVWVVRWVVYGGTYGWVRVVGCVCPSVSRVATVTCVCGCVGVGDALDGVWKNKWMALDVGVWVCGENPTLYFPQEEMPACAHFPTQSRDPAPTHHVVNWRSRHALYVSPSNGHRVSKEVQCFPALGGV